MSGLGQEDKWVLKEWTLGERFAANLVWFRHEAGLIQQELADRVGMNRTALSVLERGWRLPRLDTVLKLVAALEVKSCDLVEWMWWEPTSHHHGFRIGPNRHKSESARASLRVLSQMDRRQDEGLFRNNHQITPSQWLQTDGYRRPLNAKNFLFEG